MNEKDIENNLRKYKFFIPLVSVLVSAILFSGICFCETLFISGHYWSFVPAAFFAHAFFIVMVHDGAHRSITRTKFDAVLMNLGSGLMLLPFYAELFRKYHLIHHVNANTEHDPLWSKTKSKLFKERRGLYILCQFIPLLFNAYIIFNPDKMMTGKKNDPKIKVRIGYMMFSIGVSVTLFLIAKPSLYFILFTLLVLNFLSALRHWCEHMGHEDDKESNTFWFPLGMGIGNHDVHHDHPNYSWLTLSIGLLKKKKDTDPFKTFWRMLSDRSFKHFEYVKHRSH